MTEPSSTLLTVEGVSAGYGDLIAVRDVTLTVVPGRILLVLGRNGAGKTTLLNAIAGLLPTRDGTVHLGDLQLDRLPPHARATKGVGLVRDGKRILRRLTVEQNLQLGFYSRRSDDTGYPAAVEQAYTRFPVLRERRRSTAGSLSGGQQQMLAIAQALMRGPSVLMLDEPSAGLSPLITQEVMRTIADLRDEGMAILLVEQAVFEAVPIADDIVILEHGEIARAGTAAELSEISEIQEIYLGSSVEG